jgi:predicted DNA-binding protein YlxM (UPF0122 family)
MDNHKEQWSIEEMARTLDVSRSGYYNFIKDKLSEREQKLLDLIKKIRFIHKESRETYGSPRIHAQLRESIFEYIAVFYNRNRRHSTLGYYSPMAFEENWWQQKNISLIMLILLHQLDVLFQAICNRFLHHFYLCTAV